MALSSAVLSAAASCPSFPLTTVIPRMPDGLMQALADAWANSFEKRAIVEEYIEGEEFSCECISQDGRHTFLALTKKYTTADFPCGAELLRHRPFELLSRCD